MDGSSMSKLLLKENKNARIVARELVDILNESVADYLNFHNKMGRDEIDKICEIRRLISSLELLEEVEQ